MPLFLVLFLSTQIYQSEVDQDTDAAPSPSSLSSLAHKLLSLLPKYCYFFQLPWAQRSCLGHFRNTSEGCHKQTTPQKPEGPERCLP